MKVKRLFISGSSPTKETAGSIVKTYESGFTNIELRAIGASSVNQMIKAVATATSIFKQNGLTLYCSPGYDKVSIEGEDRTVITLSLIIDKEDKYADHNN